MIHIQDSPDFKLSKLLLKFDILEGFTGVIKVYQLQEQKDWWVELWGWGRHVWALNVRWWCTAVRYDVVLHTYWCCWCYCPKVWWPEVNAMWTSGVLYEWWGFLGQPLVKVEGVRGAIHCSLAMCLYWGEFEYHSIKQTLTMLLAHRVISWWLRCQWLSHPPVWSMWQCLLWASQLIAASSCLYTLYCDLISPFAGSGASYVCLCLSLAFGALGAGFI